MWSSPSKKKKKKAFLSSLSPCPLPMKRKRGKGWMIIGDLDSAPVVTSKTIYETNKDGTIVQKKIHVPLYPPSPDSSAIINESREMWPSKYVPTDIPSPQPEQSHIPQSEKTQWTQWNYMQQYVDHVEEFLRALISLEAMLEGAGPCQNCMKSLAIWRCRDCILATPWCWTCMCNSHLKTHFTGLKDGMGPIIGQPNLEMLAHIFLSGIILGKKNVKH